MPKQSTQRADRTALIAEAQRLYHRYATEVIEHFGFCPWAQEARRGGQVRVHVGLGRPEVADVLSTMATLAKSERIAIGLLVFPEATLGRVEFQHFAAEVRAADRDTHGEQSPTWAVADFHPDARPDLENAERLVTFIRRSPDPTLQLVRHTVLSHVRKSDVGGTKFVDPVAVDLSDFVGKEGVMSTPLHTRIAQRNLATVHDAGVAAIEQRIEEILSDRDDAYERLGLPRAPWRRRLASH
ncbi:MAG: DUF1415 family protein [Myxococcales bacterium]|nr:DUF1415 family protein [Myxococcales bacterium]